jgi:myo-inositol-1(or 4)-monophosphatase
VAAGRFDAFWALSTQSWDVAAGALLVIEAGGVVTDIDGNRFTLARPHPVATASRPLHEAFCEMLRHPERA